MAGIAKCYRFSAFSCMEFSNIVNGHTLVDGSYKRVVLENGNIGLIPVSGGETMASQEEQTAEVMSMLGQIAETAGTAQDIPMETAELDKFLEGSDLPEAAPEEAPAEAKPVEDESLKYVQSMHKQLTSKFPSINEHKEKPLQCPKCSKKFQRDSQLTAHSRYHILKEKGKLTKKSNKRKNKKNLRSYKCPFCAETRSREGLITHLEDHYATKDVAVRLGSRLDKDGKRRADGYVYYGASKNPVRSKTGAKRGRPPKSHYANLGRDGSGVKPPVTVSKRKQMGDYGRGDFVYFDDEEEDEVMCKLSLNFQSNVEHLQAAEESEDEYTPDKEEVHEAENEEEAEEEEEDEDKASKAANAATQNKIQATGVTSTDMKEGKILHTPQGTFKVVRVIPQPGGGQRVLVVPYSEDEKEKAQAGAVVTKPTTPGSANTNSIRGRGAVSAGVRGRGRGIGRGRGRDPDDPDWTEPDTPRGRATANRGYIPRGRPRGRPPKSGGFSPRTEAKYTYLEDGTKVRELTEEESGQTIIQQVKEGENVSLKLPNGQIVSLKPNKKYNISYKKSQTESISYVINTPSNMTGYPGANSTPKMEGAGTPRADVPAPMEGEEVVDQEEMETQEQQEAPADTAPNAEHQLPDNLFENTKDDARENAAVEQAETGSTGEGEVPPAPPGQEYLFVPQNLLPSIMGDGQAEEQGFDPNSSEYVRILVESSVVPALLDMSDQIMRPSDVMTQKGEPEPAPAPATSSPPMQSLLKTPQTQAMMRQVKQQQQQQQQQQRQSGSQPLVIKSSAKPGTKQQVMLTGNSGQQIVVEGIVNQQQEIIIDSNILALMT
ncbi:DgyrCDS5444 [Dimorphilus gyrociliatus]|uniref:DgyrCDS5444 n=1 Tax=Dimorphilus gyrociliatus TaxID=2664684 RepID=A0A7I8VJW0_9ANNE|nr:DgyrCDS5444 [Dimorphilus gyrociliatus]